MHIHIDRKAYARLQDEMLEGYTDVNIQSIYDLAERHSLNTTDSSSSDVQIEEVISRKLEAGKVCIICHRDSLCIYISIQFLGLFCCKTVWSIEHS